MRFRRWSGAIVALLCWALFAPLALAQSSSVIIDNDGVSGVDEARLRTAAQPLVNNGARVVIVLVQNAGADGRAYLDERLDDLRVAPSSNADDLPSDVIIYYVSFSPQTSGLFYGSNFTAALDGESARIRQDYLNAGLRRNDLTGGLVDAMRETGNVIADPVGARVEEPGGSFGSGLVWLVAIGGLGALGFFVVPRLLRNRSAAKSAQEQLASLQQRLQASHQGAGNAIADLGQTMRDASEKQRFDAVSYPKSQAAELEQRQRKAAAAFSEVQLAFDAIGQHMGSLTTPSVMDYETSIAKYDDVRGQALAISKELGAMDTLRKELDQLNARAPEEVERAKKS